MSSRKKCLFLFTELAGYMVACMKQLPLLENVEVHVVKYPVNSVAPFQFSLEGENIHFYERKDFTDEKLLDFVINLQPDIIICSGWIDKGYMKVCKYFRSKIKTVLGIDNPWRNTIKQQISALIGPFWVKKYFSHCWVPGSPQHIYARKIGFKDSNIKDGAYSCDYDYFITQYHQTRSSKAQNFPKKIIFVGRYTTLKGVTELWEAFQRFQQETPNEWELWCLGKGEFENKFPVHEKIRNFGFVQPSEMKKFIEQTGVFILPSHYEHWGVVVHEFAASGFPLICTTSTGAATTFLEEGVNGYFIEPCSVDSMVKVFHRIRETSATRLLEMGDNSARLAARITPATWSKTVMNFINDK